MRKIAITLGLTSLAMATALVAGCDRNEDAELEQPSAPAIESPEPGEPSAEEETVTAQPPPAAEQGQEQEPAATVALKSADGSSIEGEAQLFDEGERGVRIAVHLKNTDAGKKGVHVHEKGDCSDIAGKSMGSHFDPANNRQHALPEEMQASEHHLGDLGNIEISQDGEGRLEVTAAKANLEQGDQMSFLGKALVVHGGKDSGRAKQPAGASGTPIACGVIERS